MITLEFLHYRTVEKIGVGPSGTVYRGWDTHQNRPVAIKLLHKSLDNSTISSILSTVKTLKHSEHPNVCQIYKVDKNERGHFIVMEWVSGHSLEDIFEFEGLAKIDFTSFAVQVVEGLKFIHDNDMIHGNIKPSNIFLTKTGEVKLLDAGMSTIEDFQHKADFKIPLKNLYYLAPEQIENVRISDKTDLFSVGTIFYQYLTGELPFKGQNENEIFKAIMSGNPDIDKTLYEKTKGEYFLLIDKLLSKDPHNRFLHAGELIITLKAMASFEKESAIQIEEARDNKNPRYYLMISLLFLLLIIFWYVITTNR